MLTVEFKQSKVFEDKIRFKEVLPAESSESIVEEIEIPKSTLKKLGWKSSKEKIVMSIKREKEPKPKQYVYMDIEPPEGYETYGQWLLDQKKAKEKE